MMKKICVYLWNLWDKTFPRRKICEKKNSAEKK